MVRANYSLEFKLKIIDIYTNAVPKVSLGQLRSHGNTHKNFTTRGNMKSPGYLMCLYWISNIWSELAPELIKKSFEMCRIHDHLMDEFASEMTIFTRCFKTFIVDKVTIHNYITEDIELVDAEDQINENDEGIFDEPLDYLIISEKEMTIVERLEQDLMEIDDLQMDRN